MRLGMNCELPNASVEEWLEERLATGCRAVNFPLDYRADLNLVDSYVKACRENDIVIAEVGAWSNPLAKDPKEREFSMNRCIESLKFADYVGANCCVNCGGSASQIWCGYDEENYTEAHYQRTVDWVSEVIDKAAPKHTKFALEPMPWIYPMGPDDYLRLLNDIGPAHFGVHLDMCNWLNDIHRFAHQRAFMDEVFEKLKGKFICYHLKDLKLLPGVTVRFEEVAAGEGTLDIDYYMQKISEDDPEVPVLIEHLHGKEEYLNSMRYISARYGNW